jgi:pimeloyl-ACP methyl ester carboxylesterase
MLAVRFSLMYPGMVTHLVLANPIGLEDYRELVPWLPADRVYQGVLAETEDTIRAYHRAYYVKWKPEFEEWVAVHARLRGSAMFPQYAQVRAQVVQMIYEQPVVHELPLLRVPTLLVIGQSDRTAVGKARASPEARKRLGQYPELGRRAHAAIPGSRLVELTDVGHTPHLETPERFHAAVIEFLSQ